MINTYNVLLGLSSESKGEVLEWVNSVIKVVDASEVYLSWLRMGKQSYHRPCGKFLSIRGKTYCILF